MDTSTKWLLLVGAAVILLLPMNTIADPARAVRLSTAQPGQPTPLAESGAPGTNLPRFEAGLASAYGPGLYGNHMACGGVLREGTAAVAHKTLPCGAIVQVCHRGRCARARVRDRGPYSGRRTHDLTVAMVRRIGVSDARSWGVRGIRWRCLKHCRRP